MILPPSGEKPLSEEIPISLRELSGSADEIHLVLSAWLKSFQKNAYVKDVPTQRYFEFYRPFVQRVLKASRILIACDVEDANHIYGFIVYRHLGDAPVISFAYVKSTFRRMGVARRLVARVTEATEGLTARAFVTHSQWFLTETLKRHGLIYDPFLDIKLVGEERHAT